MRSIPLNTGARIVFSQRLASAAGASSRNFLARKYPCSGKDHSEWLLFFENTANTLCLILSRLQIFITTYAKSDSSFCNFCYPFADLRSYFLFLNWFHILKSYRIGSVGCSSRRERGLWPKWRLSPLREQTYPSGYHEARAKQRWNAPIL